jgi:hypothetical protein
VWFKLNAVNVTLVLVNAVRRNGAQSIPGGNYPNMYMSWVYIHLSPYTKRKIGGNYPNMYMSWVYIHLSPYTKRKICYTYISNKCNGQGCALEL